MNEIERQAAAWTDIREQFLGHTETPNGPGSFMRNTEAVRAWLPSIVDRYKIVTMLDVPCGDWNWMQTVDLTLVEEYTGWDVQPEQVAVNREMYDNQVYALGPDDMTFECVNILGPNVVVPRVDLIWCRDLTLHLTLEQNERMVDRFRRSGSAYLAITSYPEQDNDALTFPDNGHDDRPGYYCNPINMEGTPFWLNMIEHIDEQEDGKQMILVKL